MAAPIEKCSNCDRVIGKLETPHLWNDNVVCSECLERLKSSAKSTSVPVLKTSPVMTATAARPIPQKAPSSTRPRWIIPAVIGCGAVLVVLAILIFVPFVIFAPVSPPKELTNRKADAANLRTIVLACWIYAEENNSPTPDHLGRLVFRKNNRGNTVIDGDILKNLVSKRAGTQPLVMTPELENLAKTNFAAFAKKVDEHCDFVYVGKGMWSGHLDDPSVLVVFEKPDARLMDGINMAFGILKKEGAYVEFVKYKTKNDMGADVRYTLERANEVRKNIYSLPAIDIDALLKGTPAE
ncbi:MAG: hypothetical protein FWD61_12055 [Phycisphaerales bacterium]|nr:hypothetical protein [Phycisphaerales bacterium]